MGQVCARHNEYYEERCRWCEAPETDATQDIIAATIEARIAMMNANAKRFDEILGLAMTPPNDGHGIFE